MGSGFENLFNLISTPSWCRQFKPTQAVSVVITVKSVKYSCDVEKKMKENHKVQF